MPVQRLATVEDLAALWALRTRAVRSGCAAHYAPDVIEAWCAAPMPDRMPGLVAGGGCLVAEDEGRLAGYAILDVANGEVDAVFVEPSGQGRGIGIGLLVALEALARERRIGRLYLSASLNAVPFYARAGFTAIREELYPHRSGIAIASVLMAKSL
ncbi:GNAT family N-acetyltransferase [Pseudoduganella lutea]|uniref:GNAT family N-acetyltransferase n=1 Tax=Pseudoduganella lutea TaxID=321985 RepID=A0A4P6KT45_9BURK|nr:GNAT family N-acetyltransferase [Pseudoduganella lutea]QBE61824.1 GNAT family N-acetyltransferase [Pseudoduganella lutea]